MLIRVERQDQSDVTEKTPRGFDLLRLGYQSELFTEGFVCLFDLILYVPSTIFQLCRDGSFWVEPVLS